MKHGAPAPQDKPVSTLPLLDEVLDLAPALEAEWPSIRATIPPGTPVNDGGEGQGEEQPGGDTADTGPDTGQPGGEAESFYDFDPSQIPQGTDPLEWAGQQYGEMRKAFTQKTQGIAETRREAEESQALIDGLRDPETAPHYLRLLGYDLSDPAVQQHFGISAQAAADELDSLLDDEPDTDDRVAALEAQLEQQKKEGETAAYEQALDDLADQELEQIEEQWGRKLSEEEDEIIRTRAERNPDAQGLPDYATAARVLKSILSNGVEQELQRRREPGRGAPGGKPGGKALDPSKSEDRIALAAAAAERAMASEK